MAKIELTDNEIKLLAACIRVPYGGKFVITKPKPLENSMHSEFDVLINGVNNEGIPFSAHLTLYAIKRLCDWTKNEIAEMTDYPEMAKDGDWSAIRDTAHTKIVKIVRKHILPKL